MLLCRVSRTSLSSPIPPDPSPYLTADMGISVNATDIVLPRSTVLISSDQRVVITYQPLKFDTEYQESSPPPGILHNQ